MRLTYQFLVEQHAARLFTPLRKRHKDDRDKWAMSNLITNFTKVIFTDEYRATLDGPDGMSRGWLINKSASPMRLRRQQGRGGVMFWAAIYDDHIIAPFCVEDGVKMTSQVYIDLLKEKFMPYFNAIKSL